MRIVLIGFRGTGKTAVGRLLSKRLGIPLLDTDDLIETREGRSISEIFHSGGEIYFRKIEKEVITNLPEAGVVISTGGGAVLDPVNVEHLRAKSFVFFLSAEPDTIIRRIQKSKRPPLTNLPFPEEVRHLLEIRRLEYLKVADYCLDTTRTEVSAIADTVQKILEGKNISCEQVSKEYQEKIALSSEDLAVLSQENTPNGGYPRICAVMGNPASHSKSPALFNRLFTHYRLPYKYIRMEAPEVSNLLIFARLCDFRGLSVTLPFKQQVIPYLNEVDRTAQQIGAVNTIVQCGNLMHGFNTDWLGIQRPLVHLKGSKVAVIGAGGAAAAAVYACLTLDMQVTILNRTIERGQSLAERFGCVSASIAEFKNLKPEVVINATPVGMFPDTNTPVLVEMLTQDMTIFDLVYTPPETPFLQAAAKIGCTTIPGMEMFLHQAREQFLLFTGISAPEALVRELMP
ncbi:MAG: shikimate dehydrogenase [Methanomicrobiales archaeon]|nr:shikimate dehydrogenase [Methanomicrobiales archaeon]